MNKKDLANPNGQTQKGRGGQKRWHFYLLTFMACTVLVVGFFFAGRQHFSSMDYGMKNSQLRRQLDQLQAEKRRLLLAREISQSPLEIKKAAKKAGITDDPVAAPEMARLVVPVKEKRPDVVTDIKTASAKVDTPLVVRTAMISREQKPERGPKPQKRESSAE